MNPIKSFGSLVGVAFALALMGGVAHADCYRPAGTPTECIPKQVLIDPTTGQPYNATGMGGGGGSSSPTGSVGAAGTNGTQAQSIQGINGGVPVSVNGTASNGSDGLATTSTNQNSDVFNYLFNGTTWDRVRGTGGAMNVILNAGASVSVSNFPTTQNVQGIPGGVPQNVAMSDAVVPNGFPASVTVSGVVNSGVNNGIIDTTGYQTADVFVSGGGSGFVTFQESPDQTNFGSVVGTADFNAGTQVDATATTSGITAGYMVPLRQRYFRLNATYTSGTFNVTVVLRSGAHAPRSMYLGGGVLSLTGSSSLSAAGTPVTSSTSTVIGKASAGNLYGFSITQGATAGFMAFINATAAPASGATITPVDCIPVAANSYYRANTDIADRYSVGIVALDTSSCTTNTPITPTLMKVLAF